MSTQVTNNAGADQSNPTPPGQRLMGAGPIALIALYLIAFSLFVLYGLVKLWPYPTPGGAPRAEATASPSPAASPTASATATPSPAGSPAGSPSPGAVAATTPSPTASPTPSPSPSPAGLPDPEVISFLNGRFTPRVHAETRLLLLVMLAGALGSLMHSLRSLYWYTGTREMVWSWAAFYVLLPFTGAILAVIFYFVVRGGFFSPDASFQNTSPFGFAALSALVGLFSPQATLKLKEVAETIFTKPGAGKDTKPQETVPPAKGAQAPATAPQVTAVKPNSGQASETTKIVIEGQNFASGVKVTVGDSPAQVVTSSSTSIEATVPTRAAGPGVVNIEVVNPNGDKTVVTNGYTYL